MAIGCKDCFAPREGADKHEQARLGQMEVGEQAADEAEVEAWRDEDLCLAGVRFKWTADCLLCTVFQRANDGGADGDDAACTARSVVDGVCCGLGECIAFAMQVNLTCRVISALSTPRSRIRSRISGVKCRPAVGAATEPRSREKTVW